MFNPETKILVVDDMLTMRKIVIKICKELGFSSLVEAEDGAKALAVLQEANPPVGLIISDWNMPNVSGLDFLKRVRSDARFSKVPFIMVTAESEQGQVIEAIKAGVSNYVVKPFTSDQMKEKIEAVHKKLVGGK